MMRFKCLINRDPPLPRHCLPTTKENLKKCSNRLVNVSSWKIILLFEPSFFSRRDFNNARHRIMDSDSNAADFVREALELDNLLFFNLNFSLASFVFARVPLYTRLQQREKQQIFA